MFFRVWQWNAASIRPCSLLFISGTLFWGNKFSSFPSLSSSCWHILLVVFILILSCFLIIPEQSKIQRFITDLPQYILFSKYGWLVFHFWVFFIARVQFISLWGKSWWKPSSGNRFLSHKERYIAIPFSSSSWLPHWKVSTHRVTICSKASE